MKKSKVVFELFTGTEPVGNVPIFPGFWRDETWQKKGLGFSSPYFNSYAEFKRFFDRVNWKIDRMEIETSDTANFSFELMLQSRVIGHNKGKTMVIPLVKHMVPKMALGPIEYLPVIYLSGNYLNYVTAPFAEMSLSAIAACSWIRFTIDFSY